MSDKREFFEIEITETLSRTVYVEKQGEVICFSDAESLVYSAYRNGTIVLDAEDYVGMEINNKEITDLNNMSNYVGYVLSPNGEQLRLDSYLYEYPGKGNSASH